jgi:hypothetical protein
MVAFESVQLGPEFEEALSGKTDYVDDDASLIKVRPPKQNDGMDASIDMLRSFHDYRGESGVLSSMNRSDTTAFEVWYDREELMFLYYTPYPQVEEHYRRQIDGHFKGCQIEDVPEQFISTEAGEHVTGGEVWLENHYLEPIRQPENGVAEWDDPYLSLFSEMDTRDETRTMMQLLFRPAKPGWTRSRWQTVEDYADGMKDTKTESRAFGLITSERDATANEKEYADVVTSQAGTPAFYVNLRYLVIAKTQQDALSQADQVARRLQTGYQEVSGQTLTTHPCESASEVAELLEKVASREPSKMPRKRGAWEDLKFQKFGDPRKRMIMTLPEIAGVMHLPKSKNLSFDTIDWVEVPVDGSLPHQANDFVRMSDSERENQLRRWVAQEQELLDELGIEQAPPEERLFNGTPRDRDRVEAAIEELQDEMDNVFGEKL